VVFDTQDKKKLIDKFKLHETDTGSPEVQVGLLTYRISSLTEHLKIHKNNRHPGLETLANQGSPIPPE
jgi:small subunit ribosomal protein S15